VSGGITREANYSVVHPDYNSLTLENDVGLVRIDDGIEPDGIYLQNRARNLLILVN
jgi:hypothetical protein